MRYKFVKKGKKLSSADVKSQMNFSTMAANAKGLVGAKLSSAALTGGITVKAVIVSTVSVAILVTSSVVVYQEFNSVDPIEQVIEESPIIEEQLQTSDTLLVEDDPVEETVKVLAKEPMVEEEPKPVEEKVEEQAKTPARTEPKPEPKANQPVPQYFEEEEEDPLLYEDVIVKAFPLPDRSTFMKHINDHLKYPEIHIADSIQGHVDVRFKVNKMGKVDDFKISKSLGEAFDQEAIRVIESYNSWKPATYNGEAVDSYLKLTVIFQIQK